MILQTGHRNAQAKYMHSELQMQKMLQLDLLLRPANLTSPVPTWYGAPSQMNHIAKRFT